MGLRNGYSKEDYACLPDPMSTGKTWSTSCKPSKIVFYK